LAGTTFAGSAYLGEDGEYTALRSGTETALPGHHLSIGLRKKISGKWHLRAGLAYNRYRAKAEYVNTRTFDSTFLDVPVAIGVGGDTIFGVGTLRVREFREFRSYLREQRLALPLLIGRDFRLGKTRLAVRGGPEFSLLVSRGGKVLTPDGGVRPLVSGDFQQLGISARLEGELAVPLGAKGPIILGRIGFRRLLGGGPPEIRRTGNSVLGGIGLRVPLK
jgi:hypothetical protein